MASSTSAPYSSGETASTQGAQHRLIWCSRQGRVRLENTESEQVRSRTALFNWFNARFKALADANGPTKYIRLMTPWRKPYPSKDGWVAILPYDNRQWAVVLKAAGREDLVDHPHFNSFAARQANIEEVYSTLSELAGALTTDDWLATLEPHGIPCTRVNTPEDLLVDPHLADVGFWQHYDHPTEGELRTMKFPVNFEKSPVSVRRHTPHLGEQTRELLTELGYDEATVDAMLATGAARQKTEEPTA